MDLKLILRLEDTYAARHMREMCKGGQFSCVLAA